uniref:Uncharacterized protein n=1 Tax=viral metagenome TaxID=1070528 RepID=A0A6C0B8C9_9ZZZZ
MDISSFTQAPSTTQISYEFKNIDIVASNCKYISGLAPSDNNDTKIINSNNPLIQTNPGPGGFIGLHVTNYVPPSPNNITFPTTQHAYRCSDLYIYNNKVDNKNKITHNIKDVVALGELVIKHNPVVSTDPIIYLCFMLSSPTTEPARPNEIDNIINFVASTQNTADTLSTSISFSIPKQTLASQYLNSLGETIIVFNTPIHINNASKEILSNFDSSGPPDAKTLPKWLNNNPTNAFKLVEANITTRTDDNVYMECIPTGVSKEDIKAYTLPINSQYTEEASKIEFMGTTVRFTFLVLFVLILYSAFPTFWNAVTQAIGKDKNEELDAAQFWYGFYFVCIFAVTLPLGLIFNFDSTHITISFLVIFTLALTSTMILFSRKVTNPGHYIFQDFKTGVVMSQFITLFESPIHFDTGKWEFDNIFTQDGWPYLWLVLILIVGSNLAIIAIEHRGKLPTSINTDPKTPSSDPNVMNILELLDYVFGDFFALIAIRVVYKIYTAIQG